MKFTISVTSTELHWISLKKCCSTEIVPDLYFKPQNCYHIYRVCSELGPFICFVSGDPGWSQLSTCCRCFHDHSGVAFLVSLVSIICSFFTDFRATVNPISFRAFNSMRSILASYLGIFFSGGRMLYNQNQYELVSSCQSDRVIERGRLWILTIYRAYHLPLRPSPWSRSLCDWPHIPSRTSHSPAALCARDIVWRAE